MVARALVSSLPWNPRTCAPCEACRFGGARYRLRMLVGREPECSAIDRLLEDARRGTSGAVVLRGEPGIGKTALVAFAVERAADMVVVRAQGVQSEAEFAFAGLLEVSRPLLGKIEELPERQAAALRAVLALGAAVPPDRLAVGAATLSLLAAAAEDAPLLVTIDDAHWLDAESADALTFAARRLEAERVAMLIAAREGEGRRFDNAGLDEIQVSGLSLDATATLLAAAGLPSEDALAERLHSLTGGNPLALLELPRWLGDGDRPGEAVTSEPMRVGERLESAFAARAATLDERTRDALLVLASSSTDDSASITAALATAGLSTADLVGAEDAGLIHITLSGIRFRHPLVRSALYHSASPSQRRVAHRALANALESRDAEGASWHRAAATPGPDETVAAALERTGDDSRLRGGSSAASAAYECAARLSLSHQERARRLQLAAREGWLAGQATRALALVAEAITACHDDLLRGELLYLGGEIERFTGRPGVAHRMLLDAADLARPFDPERAALMLAEAADASFQLGSDASVAIVAAFDKLAVPPGGVGDFRRLVALSQAASHRGSHSFLEHARAATLLVEHGGVDLEAPRDLVWAGYAYWSLGEYRGCRELAERAVTRARETATGVLPDALRLLAQTDHATGRWNAAYAAASEALEVASALGMSMIRCACSSQLAAIAAARGQAAACRSHANEAIRLATELDMGGYLLRAKRALALLALGEGRLDDAIRTLEEIRLGLVASGNREYFSSPVPDLIEALVRAGRRQEAGQILRELEPLANPEPGGELAILERCRGLVAGKGFLGSFERAIAHHSAWDNPFELARTQLCSGERLRRDRRRREAREQLRAAQATFERLAAEPWARRARTELRATGETVRRRDRAEEEQLTPQELQIAIHAAEGKSNREIGAALFLSPRTVEFHLTRVYRKLNIHSRAELIRRFPAEQLAERLSNRD